MNYSVHIHVVRLPTRLATYMPRGAPPPTIKNIGPAATRSAGPASPPLSIHMNAAHNELLRECRLNLWEDVSDKF